MDIVNEQREDKSNPQTPRFISIPLSEYEELGFSLEPGNLETPYASIANVLPNTASGKRGLLEGMILSRLNGRSTFEMSHDDLNELLQQCKRHGILELVLVGRDPYMEEKEISLDPHVNDCNNLSSGNLDRSGNSNGHCDSSNISSFPQISDIASVREPNFNQDNRHHTVQKESCLNLYGIVSEIVENLVPYVDSRQELASLKYLSSALQNTRFRRILRYYEILWSFHYKNNSSNDSPHHKNISFDSDSKHVNDLKVKLNVAFENKLRKSDSYKNVEKNVSNTFGSIIDTYNEAVNTCRDIKQGSIFSYKYQKIDSRLQLSKRSMISRTSSRAFESSSFSRRDLDTTRNSFKLQYMDKVQLVTLELGDQPIGITMVNKDNCVIISRVLKQSVADLSGLMKKGDEILEINNKPVKGMDVEMVANLVRELNSQTLSFLMIPCDLDDFQSSFQCNSQSYSEVGTMDQSIVWSQPFPSPYSCEYDEMGTPRALSIQPSRFLRARFNYNPLEDTYSPCPFLGLKFRIGDILEIIDREDHNYWQARKIKKTKFFYSFEAENRVGLVPSKIFYHQCEAINYALMANKAQETASLRCLNCLNCMDSEQENLYESKSAYSQSYQEMKLVPSDPFNRRPLIILTRKVESLKAIFSRMESERGASCSYLKLHAEILNVENTLSHEVLNQICETSKSGKVCMMIFDDKYAEILSKCSLRPYIVLMMEPQIRVSARFKWENWPSSQYQNLHPQDLLHALPYIDATLTWKSFESLLSEFNEILTGLLALPQWIPIV